MKQTNIVAVMVQGGLGNQLFQYAFGRVLANETSSKLIINTKLLESKRKNVTTREFGLSKFGFQFETSSDVNRVIKFYDGKLGFVFKKLSSLLFGYIYVDENNSTFNFPIESKQNKNYIFNGYWQSKVYFEKIKDILRDEIRSSYVLPKSLQSIAKIVAESNSVSLHVRRGDFITNPKARELHAVCDVDYYFEAIEKIRTRVHAPFFIIFSDDPNWAKEQIGNHVPCLIVSGHYEILPHDEMVLMSYCKHHIIANSTFSWWGASLNPNEDKIIVSPKKWYLDNSDMKKLIPESWILI
jgi:hypothetical protein